MAQSPTNGRVLYLTICCTTSASGRPWGGAEIAVLINDLASRQSTVLDADKTASVVTFTPPLQFNLGDKTNFISKSEQLYAYSMTSTAFVELS